MKVVVIHGQNHKGSTYHIARMLADKLSTDVTEFFLPKDLKQFCIGCTNCFTTSETDCPHYESVRPITKAMDEADVIILASPVYVYHVTAGMKNLLDHYAYRWMVHRPEKGMFKKQAVCISTAAGGGMKSTIKDMAHSTYFWGVAKTYRYGAAVRAVSWETVEKKTKQKIERNINSLSHKIKKRNQKVKPSIKTKAFFLIMRFVQKRGWCEADVTYWNEMGWTGKKRPWKNK